MSIRSISHTIQLHACRNVTQCSVLDRFVDLWPFLKYTQSPHRMDEEEKPPGGELVPVNTSDEMTTAHTQLEEQMR